MIVSLGLIKSQNTSYDLMKARGESKIRNRLDNSINVEITKGLSVRMLYVLWIPMLLYSHHIAPIADEGIIYSTNAEIDLIAANIIAQIIARFNSGIKLIPSIRYVCSLKLIAECFFAGSPCY